MCLLTLIWHCQVDVWNIPSGNYYYVNGGNAARPAWVTSKVRCSPAHLLPAQGLHSNASPETRPSFKVVSQYIDPVSGARTTVVCFSRPLVAPSASSASAALALSAPIRMVYAVAGDGVTDFGSQHAYQGEAMI